MNNSLKIIIIIGATAMFFSKLMAQNESSISSADSTILLNEITVKAYQARGALRNIPGSISVLTADEPSAWDANSMAGVINTLPGVHMQNGTYATNRIVIRGMGSRTPYNTNRIKFYINDIPITSSDGVSNPEDIDLMMIDRLEIIKGPASALYGSGLGGTINMMTAYNKPTSTLAKIQYGAYNTVKGNINQAIKTNQYSLNVHLSAINSDGYRQNNHLKKRTALLTGKTKLKWFDLETFFYATYMNAGIPSSLGETLFEKSPQLAANNWNEINGYKRYNKGVGAVTLSNQFSPQMKNKLTLFGRWNDSYEKRPFNNLDDASLSGGIRNKLSYHSKNIDVQVGLELISDAYKWKIDKDDKLENKNKETRTHLNLFSIVYYRPISKLNISLAAAYNKIVYKLKDQFIEDGDSSGSRSFPAIFSPRLGVNYMPDKKLSLYASVGRGFSLPSPEETLLPEGNVNPDIKPETGTQYELGARVFLLNNNMNFDITLYWIDLKNLLVTDRLTEEIFTGINAGQTSHKGLEFSLKNRFFSYNQFPGKLSANLSYTFTKNKFINFTNDDVVYDGKALPGIPKHTAQIQFQWTPLHSLLFEAQLQSVGRQFLNDANTLKTSAYYFGNMKISKTIEATKSSAMSLYVGVNNFTNSHYASMVVVNAKAFGANEPRYYYPGLPRHAYMGITWSF